MRYGDGFTDGQVTKEAILRLVNERRALAENAYRNFFQKTKSWYNIFRGIMSGKFAAHRNDVVVPILYSQVMSDVANKAQAIFGDNEIIQFIPNHDRDVSSARKNSNLVNMQLADADSYVKGVDFFLSAAVYGTGIARTSWRHEKRTKLYRTNIMGQEQIIPHVKTVFDGPNWEVVDILDFLPEPGKRRLKDCNWVVHTYYVDLDDLLEMQSGGGTPTFSPDAVMELLDSPMGADARDAWKLRTDTYRNWTDYEQRGNVTFGKPVRIDEYWGKVPSEFAINGDRNLVITVANEKVILRYEPNPYWEDQLPFLIYTPMPDMHSLHGTGKAEVAEKLQATINRLANIKLDALELFANPGFFTSNGSGLDTQNLVMRPGKNFKVDAEDVGKAVVPISPDLRALQMTYQEIQQISGMQQQGLGISNDVIQGMSGPDRETARGFLSRKEAAMGRLAAESAQAEHMFIIPLAQKFKGDNAQFLDLPKQIQMIGPDAIMDPITGLPMQGGAETMTYDDFRAEYKCRAVGSSRLMSKSILAQQLTTFGQLAMANPALTAMVNWVNFARIISKALNLNPTELLIEQAQVPLINQVAMQMGQSPEQMVGGMVQGQATMPQMAGMGETTNEPIPMLGGTSENI